MVSLMIPPLPFLRWPSSIAFSDQLPANFEALLALCHQFSTLFKSESTTSFMSYAVGAFLAITVPSWIILLYCNSKRGTAEPIIPSLGFACGVDRDLLEVDDEFAEAQDAFSQGNEGAVFPPADTGYAEQVLAYDAKYAEEMQFHEALIASIFSFPLGNITSSSLEGQIIGTELANFQENCTEDSENEVQNPSEQTFCEICMENKESWEMFKTNQCSHTFCYDCTTNHILAKIHDRAKTVTCPGINCKAVLNFDICRLLIPEDALVQWDEILCQSLIPESQKLYCPYRDCSTMLVNDTQEEIRNVRCVACKRSFCALCRVPWHSEFTCKEFQKLYARKGGKDEKIVKILAKKKKWQKCPKCKMYVEKAEGCVHITCRCKYEFCYTCGAKWADSHNCQHKRLRVA